MKWDVSLLPAGKHSCSVYGMSKCIWLSRLGTSRSAPVTQAAVFAGRDLEFCVWHWKINGLIHKQTHRCMHEFTPESCPKASSQHWVEPATSAIYRSNKRKRIRSSHLCLSLSCSLILISSDLLSSPVVSSDGGSWRRTVIKRGELNRKHKQTCAQANKQTHVIKRLSLHWSAALFVVCLQNF